jgi:3',5'-cyclic AMP phosphodiesterase CpdA
MKIALITDTHFGARGDSIPFNDYFFRFWENTFFPYIEEHKIKHIVHLGDFVDRRKFINYQILNTVRTSFLDKIPAGCHMDVIVGNHDVPFRNTNEVNAIQELFGDRENVTVYSRPFTITFDGSIILTIKRLWISSSPHRHSLRWVI